MQDFYHFINIINISVSDGPFYVKICKEKSNGLRFLDSCKDPVIPRD